mmetsp:Transcript_29054/g.70879  ORF Transcript_29054/g.70879 Transcript_29054/m.70879 type:complete len:102 (-) Transcript_29054:464-769(-)
MGTVQDITRWYAAFERQTLPKKESTLCVSPGTAQQHNYPLQSSSSSASSTSSYLTTYPKPNNSAKENIVWTNQPLSMSNLYYVRPMEMEHVQYANEACSVS